MVNMVFVIVMMCVTTVCWVPASCAFARLPSDLLGFAPLAGNRCNHDKKVGSACQGATPHQLPQRLWGRGGFNEKSTALLHPGESKHCTPAVELPWACYTVWGLPRVCAGSHRSCHCQQWLPHNGRQVKMDIIHC